MTGPIVVGARVGVTYREEHGHRGTVLARNDPRAWQGKPQADIDAELERLDAYAAQRGEPAHRFGATPIAWDFGRVYWERDDAIIVVEEVQNAA